MPKITYETTTSLIQVETYRELDAELLEYNLLDQLIDHTNNKSLSDNKSLSMPLLNGL
jgi:hypothetical protein